MGLRDLMFRGWYWYVNKADKNAEVLFMNYGYHDDNEKIELSKSDEPNRYSAQLYHRLARTVDLNGKDIVEIGCGRGGGLSYIANSFKPKTALGIDIDARAAKFGNEYYKSKILKFEQGDAQQINLDDASIDIVFNVESSHRYPEMEKFLSEVYRVLKPGGYFLITDFRYSHEMDEYHEMVKKFDFKKFDEQIINPNVVSALEHDTPRREGLVKKLTPKMIHKTALNFAGVIGSETFNQIKKGDYTYFVNCFQKN
jgi:ubiquinone/menaquinone biosynthesis C-methylase UbiE